MNAVALDTASPQPEPDSAPLDELRHRLSGCARWILLLAEEVDAVEAADADRVCRLAAERRRIEVELLAGEAGDAAATVGRVVEQALGVIEGRSEAEQRARDWIVALQDASLPLLRRLPLRQGTRGRYNWTATWDARVNVRF